MIFVVRSVLLIITVVFGSGVSSAQKDHRPNVIFILTDDHGALDAGCYGSSDLKTPHLDRLAREGVRFTNAYAHTVCCPARAMLMTGRHPQRGDIGSWAQGATTPTPQGKNLLHSEQTAAEIFRDAGYATACFGKWHLGAAVTHGPTRQGFQEFFGIRGGFIDNYNHYFLHDRGRHDLYERDVEVFRDGEYFMEMVTQRSVEFMRTNLERPFFLYYAMNLPHYPEQSLETFRDDFKDLKEPRRSYAKILATTDHLIGELLNELDRLGLAENTLVMVTGDNGYSAEDYQISVPDHLSGLPQGQNYGPNAGGGNTGKWRGAKGSFLEGGLRVPALLRYPKKITKGQTRDATVTLMDWLPTAAHYAGISLDRLKLDGRSVHAICDSNDLKDNHYHQMNWGWQKGWAAREGNWKLIQNGSLGLKGSGVNAKDNRMPKTFLGNLDDEHPELKNYASERPDLVRKLTEQHDVWATETAPIESERWKP